MTRITDQERMQIRNDRQQGLTLYQLVTKYARAKSTVAAIIVGCDTSKVKRAAPGRSVVHPVAPRPRPLLSKTDLGEASRQLICGRLMMHGIAVFRPMTEDTPIDLLVLHKDGSVARCQCKYVFPTRAGCHVMPLYAVRHKGIKHNYTAAEVDFYLGYCLDNDTVYVVPASIAIGRRQLHLWILRSPQGRTSKACFDAQAWAARYDLLS